MTNGTTTHTSFSAGGNAIGTKTSCFSQAYSLSSVSRFRPLFWEGHVFFFFPWYTELQTCFGQSGSLHEERNQPFQFLKRILFIFPLVLNGFYHYWTYVYLISTGRKTKNGRNKTRRLRPVRRPVTGSRPSVCCGWPTATS